MTLPDSQDLAVHVRTIAQALADAHQTLATAECSIAGALGAALTDVPGASAWYVGGVAPYSARAKEALLGLSPDAFARHGAVSPESALLMAQVLRAKLGADWTLAETGLTGPRGTHRSAKELGTVYFALLGPGGLVVEHELRTGLDDRAANKRAFLAAAVALLAGNISKSVEISVL
jgi:nicotinamide-nucleotide amidase